MCTVVNRRYDDFDIYIGRGSKWGNPYTHIADKQTKAEFVVATRAESITAYKTHLWNQIKAGIVTAQELRALDGKRLGCYCYPKSCHGDVIAAAVKWAKERNDTFC